MPARRVVDDDEDEELHVNAGPPPVTYQDVTLGDVERRFAHPAEPCWGCRHFGRHADATRNPALYKLWQTYEMSVSSLADDAAIAKQLAKAYKDLIYDPRARVGDPVEVWDAAMIEIHIREHMHNPRVIFRGLVKRTHLTMRQLDQCQYRQDVATGRTEPIYANIKALREEKAFMLTLLKTNPDEFFAA